MIQQQVGAVLGIHFQLAQPGGAGTDRFDFTGEPPDVVDFVAQFEQYAAAQGRLRTDSVAVVGAGPPVGQILADFGADRQDSADPARCDGRMRGDQ